MKNYFKVTPASYLIFEKGDKILLIKRANTGYYDGHYSLPAGHFDGSETAKKVAVREAKEEVGLRVKPEDLELVHVSHRKSPIPIDHERLDLFFRVTRWEGEPFNNEPHKHEEIKWFKTNKLPENIVPEVHQAIAKASKGENYGEFGF